MLSGVPLPFRALQKRRSERFRRPVPRHTKLESAVRYLGIEVDDALEIDEQTEA